MAEPVIIDDGGSTRIKQIKGPTATGKLDALLDNLKDTATGPFKKLTISCIDAIVRSPSPRFYLKGAGLVRSASTEPRGFSPGDPIQLAVFGSNIGPGETT